MRLPMLAAASALALAACGGESPRAIAKLDCPATEGDLTRVSAAADGKSCVYRSSEGAEVTLELIALKGGDAATALSAVEAELRTAAPSSATPAATAATPATTSQAAADAAKAQAEALADAAGKTDATASEPQTTRVNLPGIHIEAVEGGGEDSAKVEIGPLKIDANDDDATVRLFREVRMRGEAFSREKRGIRATFIYTGKDLPADYRYVGYQAGGPKTGPLTVARIRARESTEAGDNINHDVEELVRRNGGV